MDAQPTIENQQHGLGSWHPAMRPNAHENKHNEDKKTDEAFPDSTINESTSEGGPQSLQLPIRPRSGLQEQLLFPSSQTADSRHADDVIPSLDGPDDIGIEGCVPFASVDGSRRLADNAVDADTTQTDSPEFIREFQDSKKETIHGPAQQASLLLDDDTREVPMAPTSVASDVKVTVGHKREMDRAWEVAEKELPLKRLANLSRTNSFPLVPPLLQDRLVAPLSLPLSQVEDIIEEDMTAGALDHEFTNNAFPSIPMKDDAPQIPIRATAQEDSHDYFANPLAQATTSIGETGEGSRYDEGLPLIQSLQSEPTESLEDEIRAEAKAPDSADEENPFNKSASQLSEDISAFKPLRLDRKSTAQVLDSIHYTQHSTTHPDSQSVYDKSSLANSMMGSIPVAPHTSHPQILSGRSTDEDLADLWKAALGDDDLLEEDENPVDPAAFFDDDGEGFLEGFQPQPEEYVPRSDTFPPILEPVYSSDGNIGGPRETIPRPTAIQNRYLPNSTSQPEPIQQLPQGTLSLNHSASAPTGFTDPMRQPSYSSQTSLRPQMPSSTQSFADKSKGGYTSPYDLPMEITRPKKRGTFQPTNPSPDVQPTSSRPPPPRSSSMFTGVPPLVKSHPPIPRPPNAISSTPNGNAISVPSKAPPSQGSFFEELQPSSKPRPSSSMGRFVSSVNQPTPPPPVSSQREPVRQSSFPQAPVSRPTESPQPYQLLPPERMSLYGPAAQADHAGQTVPAVNARYSPAPPLKPSAPPPSNRYAASPSTGSRPLPPQALPFQPRTSSPLAQGESLPLQHQEGSKSDMSFRRPQPSVRQVPSAQESEAPSFSVPYHQSQNIGPSAYPSESTGGTDISYQTRQSPPTTHNTSLNNLAQDPSHPPVDSPPSDLVFDREALFPQDREMPSYTPTVPSHGPPRRSQTSSPGAGRYMPQAVGAQIPYQRPASVNNQMSPLSAETKLPFSNQARPRGNTFSKHLNYIRPTDGRELDLLERWKGSPIFSFGFGGALVTSFPARVPRYAAGQPTPMIKCSPGEIKLQDGKILPLEEDIAAFPGPLKSKGKKKDVLDWLQGRISKMEQDAGAYTNSVTLPDPSKRHEEKIILWKVVQVFVENDGAIESSPSAKTSITSILSPELIQDDSAPLPLRSANVSFRAITRHSGSRASADPVSPDTMEGLRKQLLNGEREKAVWHAVDHRLWAHAMLLSSTLDKNIWKQVSQEFVRQEVKTYGDNTEALAALYQIFAGNGDECADELVPPSARAGLQMVSKTAGSGLSKNALDGLDRWRETLTLILSNRSPDDGDALVSLGRLLASYGRTEAAHVCYIFAKLPGLFGGPDEPQVSVALLGADHIQHPFEYDRDIDSILLTEVYDFSRTILASSSAATVSPHLQSFKLYHALILAEYGYKSEAQQYCEFITNTLHSTTKRSPYYHNLLLGALDNLMERLRQAPKDNSGSWISKPSIDKVSGSLWAKFNQYVAGDESDAASTGSGKGRDPAAGPFAGVAGDSPTLSRTPSSNDLYSSYTQGVGMNQSAPMVNSSVSRYAPAGLYTPRSSLEQQGRSSQDFHRPSQVDTLRPAFSQQQYQSRPTSSTSSQQETHKPTVPSTYSSRADSYLPTPPSQPQYIPEPPPEEPSSSFYQQEIYQPAPPLEPQVSRDQSQPHANHEASSGYNPPSSAYEPASFAYGAPSTNGYEPTSSSGYDPPSYNSEIPQAEGSPVEERPKKKSFMDDDDNDDFEARAAGMRRREKAQKDREADEAFRRAAEADGKHIHF